jgi:hypothetical protein
LASIHHVRLFTQSSIIKLQNLNCFGPDKAGLASIPADDWTETLRSLSAAFDLSSAMIKRQSIRTALFVCSLFCLCALAAETQAGPGSNAPLQLIVVGPESFRSALREFLSFKQTLLTAEFVSLESILSTSAGVDDPERLKHFLYAQWKGRGLKYVLLVGDVDIMPVRYMVLDRATPAAMDYAFYPSDLYYSDLAKADGSFEDWNARKDSFHAGYFGEVRGEKNKQDPINYDQVDYRPEIGVGRWPVSTASDAGRAAAKTIAYEKMLNGDTAKQMHRAGFVAVGGWVDSRPLLKEASAKLAKSWDLERRFYSDRDATAETPPPDRPQVRALFSSGVGLVVHAGHGQSDAWERCLSVRDLETLTNSSMFPVVLSAGCSTAYFAPLAPYDGYVDVDGKEHSGTDHGEVFSSPPPPPAPYQRGKFNPTGLGEQMLKAPNAGAVAYIGCDTGSQPCALTLVEGFVTAVAELKEPRLGDCWSAAIKHYYEHEHLATLKPTADWYPPSIFFQGMKFMVFGDPSLRLPEN